MTAASTAPAGANYVAVSEKANAKTLCPSARGHDLSCGCGCGGVDGAGGCAVFLILSGGDGGAAAREAIKDSCHTDALSCECVVLKSA